MVILYRTPTLTSLKFREYPQRLQRVQFEPQHGQAEIFTDFQTLQCLNRCFIPMGIGVKLLGKQLKQLCHVHPAVMHIHIM